MPLDGLTRTDWRRHGLYVAVTCVRITGKAHERSRDRTTGAIAVETVWGFAFTQFGSDGGNVRKKGQTIIAPIIESVSVEQLRYVGQAVVPPTK